MNRRQFLAGAAALASANAFADEPIRVAVARRNPGYSIAADFMGLGYEISSVARPGLLHRDNRVYVQLVRTLAPRGVIRIGGNTSDYARYSPLAAPVSTPKGTVVNDRVLKDLGGFCAATGWKLIWGLNLGAGSEKEAVAEAKAVIAGAGANLLAFEIGNEPDLFGRAGHRPPGYGYEEWLADYRRFKKALRQEIPNIRFAGPDAARETDWVTRFANDEGRDAVLLTHHYYREGQNPASTIEKLLAPDPKLEPELAKLNAASKASGLPYRICEVNSFSGGGRAGVSDTMAAALWVLDYLFTLAASGCAGVNMETGVNQLDFVSHYSPIGDDEHGHYSARPEYYGMLAFALAAKGRMVAVEMNAPPEVKAWAAQNGGALALTLINKGRTPRSFEVEANRASLLRLSAPSIEAKSGVSLAAAEVTSSGAWKPSKIEHPAAKNGRIRLDLPAASAAILEIG
ncbi:MAG TPA: glycosyl hydrolase family 79 C-terminal domain-containing protein [Bryobacteraceae bacterium]|jgi:hypothetical protein|nr:glycosyl hydrolase family 79 C-terminal domain-containing protein [Bryobacteraceae bacterium]